MRKIFRQLRRDLSGTVAVEFGMVFPIFLVVLLGMLEFGNYLNQRTMLEKGLRAGAVYAARTDTAVTAVGDLDTTAITNIVMTGDPTNSTDYILQGWDDSKYAAETNKVCAAAIKLCIQVIQKTDPIVGGGNETYFVIKLFATVPYDSLMSGALDIIGIGGLTMNANHEQAWIGS